MLDNIEKNCGIERNTHQNIFLTISITILILALIIKVILTILFPNVNVNQIKKLFDDVLPNIKKNYALEENYSYQNSQPLTLKQSGFSKKLANAVQHNNIIFVKSAIENGADVNGKDVDDNEVLSYLSHTTSPEIIQYLLDKGCNPNHKNKHINTPLMFAIREDNIPAVKVLIQNGANITDTTRSGRTMMSFAKSTEMKNYLSSLEGIDLPEIMTRNWWRHTNLSEVKSHTEELSSHIKDGRILPLATANVSDLSIIQYLLDLGYNILQENDNGDFPLLTAASSNTNSQMILFLIENGANVNQQSSKTGMTPLMSAAYFQGNPEIFHALLNSGADLNIQDIKGNKAADYAKQFNSAKIYELLAGPMIFY